MDAETKADFIPRYDRLKLRLTRRCACNCGFCRFRGVRGLPEPTLEELGRALLLARRRGFQRLILTGGEPTLSPHLLQVAAMAAKMGMRFELRTTGQGLDDRLLDFLAARGLDRLRVDLHGPTPEAHAAVCGADLFGPALAALSAAVARGLARDVRLTAVRDNLPHLTEMPGMLKPFLPLTLNVAAVDPAALDAAAVEAYVPEPAATAAAFRELWETVVARPDEFGGLELVFSGLPFCLLPGDESAWAEARADGLAETCEPPLEGFQRTRYLNRTHLEPCGECERRGVCPGPNPKLPGVEAALKPLKRPVTNSLAYAPVRELPGFDPAHCPILRGELRLSDPDREVIIAADGRPSLCRTDARDLDPRDIARERRRLQQMYLDVGPDLFSGDFAADLRKLDLHSVCMVCPNFNRCGACWTPSPRNVFTEAENAVADLLGGLKGRVLDVGAGRLRHAEVLCGLIAAGSIAYTALEPDPPPELLDFIAQSPENRLLRERLEDASLEPESFDWIMVLRSYNHLYDVKNTFDKLKRALVPGGKLLVVDNTLWGAVYDAAKWAKLSAIRGEPCFEHYRNHDSEAALKAIPQDGLTLLRHDPIRKGGANQWLLLFGKDEKAAD